MGPEHDAFEAEFAAYVGVASCLGVGSGTDALELSLRALRCGPGDEVVCVANAGMYAAAACITVGAAPVFVDVLPGTLSLDQDLLVSAFGPRTKVVVVTHLYGLAASIEDIVTIARRAGLAVIEDCAQAHGARVGGKAVGTFGDLGTFSFYPTKNLGAVGDGGAIVTDRADLAERVRALRQYGWISRNEARVAGGRNSRLDELQAAVLRRRLPTLDAGNRRRRHVVDRYRQVAGKRAQLIFSGDESFVGHLAVLRTRNRDRLRAALERRGIPTSIHYPVPDHCQPALKGSFRTASDLGVSECASAEVLSLPCFPELTDIEIERICRGLDDALRECGSS